jgi:hypothetical protein
MGLSAGGPLFGRLLPVRVHFVGFAEDALKWVSPVAGTFTLKKLECLKQALA